MSIRPGPDRTGRTLFPFVLSLSKHCLSSVADGRRKGSPSTSSGRTGRSSTPFTTTAKLKAAGFTLIEVMVALAVFGLAALALVRLQSVAVRGTAFVDRTTLAQIVARNVAIDAMTSARPPANGRTTGIETNGGRTWRWTRDVRPTGDVRILRIDVAVADRDGTQLGRLTMIRPPAAVAAAP